MSDEDLWEYAGVKMKQWDTDQQWKRVQYIAYSKGRFECAFLWDPILLRVAGVVSMP